MDRNKIAVDMKKEELENRRTFEGFTNINDMQSYYKGVVALRRNKLTAELDKKAIESKELQIKTGKVVEIDETQLGSFWRKGKKPIWVIENEIELIKGKSEDLEIEAKVHQAQITYFLRTRKEVK